MLPANLLEIYPNSINASAMYTEPSTTEYNDYVMTYELHSVIVQGGLFGMLQPSVHYEKTIPTQRYYKSYK